MLWVLLWVMMWYSGDKGRSWFDLHFVLNFFLSATSLDIKELSIFSVP